VNRTDLQNLIDAATSHGRITPADAAAASARMRDGTSSTASILAEVETAIATKAASDGVIKTDIDIELAAALGLSTLS
jgi:hypothetical protein